ncbi:MAG: integrase [Candidatus Methanoperedens nitroreducens]|uniref:Integrase n=1 Tax=Candidatus Methanoperedens nitratireducens TaxID=1392998 RepID=A0A0P8A5H6_9EURY|nr:MAG: integrase [Candidatus Methanoperedens sp. BLZ1]
MYMLDDIMMLEDFKKSLIAKNRSKNTLDTIKYSLEPAQAHFGKPLENLTIEHLKKYFEILRAKGLSQNTIRLQQTTFAQFYDYCLSETDDEKYSVLIRKLKRLKVDKEKNPINPGEILFPDEIKRLINIATLERDRCIVASLFESGLRIGELLALTIDMVQMDEAKQEVTFHIPNIEGCKTGSRSVVCLEIYGYVQDWLKCNPEKHFIPVTKVGVTKILKKLFIRAGINKPCNPHHFRHSSITLAAGSGMSETQLSYRFWGIPHSTMLSVYIHLNEQMKSSGYRDAKGLGENGNGKTVINPLACRCVECGKLIQSGSLCKSCSDSKKLSQENNILKSQMSEMQKQMLNLMEWVKADNKAGFDEPEIIKIGNGDLEKGNKLLDEGAKERFKKIVSGEERYI